MQVEGNEEALEKLRAVLAIVFDGDDYAEFTLSMKTFTEATVDALVENQKDDTTYVDAHKKLDGTLKLPKKFKADYVDVIETLGKCGIENLIS